MMGQQRDEAPPRTGAGAGAGPRRNPQLKRVPGYISAISGASAGLVAGIVVCPLDVVKTRLQIQGSLLRGHHGATPVGASSSSALTRGVVGTLKHIVKEEGVRSLYNGLTPLLVGYLPSWAIYFYVYKSMQEKLDIKAATSPGSGVAYLPELECAVIAGACSTIATNPIWMIKTRMMAQSQHTSWRYNGVIDAARSIYAQEGVRKFYSGLSSALLGLPHVAIHFPLYEKLKNRWAPQRQWHGILAASVVSKVIASTITYPHEVIRSRNQIKTPGDKYRGIVRTARTLWIEEGWRVFYAGLTANICRAMPASAVTLMTFELVSSTLTSRYVANVPSHNTANAPTANAPTANAPTAKTASDSITSIVPPNTPPPPLLPSAATEPAVDLGTAVVDVLIQRDNDDIN